MSTADYLYRLFPKEVQRVMWQNESHLQKIQEMNQAVYGFLSSLVFSLNTYTICK